MSDDVELASIRALGRAILEQALHDAFKASDSDLVRSRPQNIQERAAVARTEAQQWLTAEGGLDAKDRAIICDLAGFDAEDLRERAIKHVELTTRPAPQHPRRRKSDQASSSVRDCVVNRPTR